MGISLRVDGVSYNRFKQIDGMRSRDTFCSEVRIITSMPDNNESIMKIGSLIEIYRDDIKDFTGYIEKITDSDSRDSHDVSWTARSKVIDLVRSSVPISVTALEGVTTFASLVTQCIDGLGLSSDISVTDNVGAEFSDSEALKSADTDDNVGDFLQANARIVNVFINDDGDGNVVITQDADSLSTYIQNVPGAINNNVKSSTFTVDYTDRFYSYTVFSNSSLSSESATSDNLDNEGSATDDEIRETLRFTKIAEKPMTAEQCATAAAEEANIRRARSFAYSCDIAGFSANGELWEPNKLVTVKDTLKGVSGQFLINTVTWTYGSGGETVKMDITLPDKCTVVANATDITERQTTSSSTYTVVEDDTLSQIAVNYGVSLDSLVAANPQIENIDLIYPDQSINIPVSGGS